jgi:hypothetical protein
MADTPNIALKALFVHPGAIAAAEAPVRAIGDAVRHSADPLPSGKSADFVGDPVCAQNLLSTCRRIVQAISASAAGLDKLAEALAAAATTYRFSESDAVAGIGS